MSRTSAEEITTEKSISFPDRKAMYVQYESLMEKRKIALDDLELRLETALSSMISMPALRARIKDFDSYFRKYLRLLETGESAAYNVQLALNGGTGHPLITDIIGIRIVCPFIEDLTSVEEILKNNFDVIEVERKGRDHTFREFGYESVHLLIKLPKEIIKNSGHIGCEVAEIQIRTILQDAWAEVEHELIYKSEFNPFDEPLKRKLAAVNASLSLADIIFQEIRGYLRNLHGELGKRRESFFKKIEASTDALLFEDRIESTQELFTDGVSEKYEEDIKLWKKEQKGTDETDYNESIDDLLLGALTSHNKNHFSEAIDRYTRILKLKPEDSVSSLIYKHRGMAFFARSHYEEAISDFRRSLKLDPKSYKAAYYEGIICAVLRDYPKALDAFNLSLEINPYQPYCFYRRGQAYFHLEDFPHALADCEAALALESFDGAKKLRSLVLNKLKM